MAERTDAEILAELGVEPVRRTTAARSPREVRIIAGFDDIQRFVAEHDRQPQHGDDRDIFERLYAVRLDRLRSQPECVALLRELDLHGLLAETAAPAPDATASEMDDDALLAILGADDEGRSSITELRHVRPAAERRAAEEVAVRHSCDDFEQFAPLFEALRIDLDRGVRDTRRFERKSEIEPGRFFIVDGLIAYVAGAGESFMNESGNRDRRLRVIYDNGTESNLLARSLQKALTQDPAGRRVTEPEAGPLFQQEVVQGSETGTVYVLRSRSHHPEIAKNRELIHKIGVTGGEVQKRLAGAEKDPTFLLAPVDVVATFRLYDINRTALENLLHRFFAGARLDVAIPDRLGAQIKPREWFLVPLPAIREAVERLQQRSLHLYEYRPERAELARRA